MIISADDHHAESETSGFKHTGEAAEKQTSCMQANGQHLHMHTDAISFMICCYSSDWTGLEC